MQLFIVSGDHTFSSLKMSNVLLCCCCC